jgi:hypothetical protein
MGHALGDFDQRVKLCDRPVRSSVKPAVDLLEKASIAQPLEVSSRYSSFVQITRSDRALSREPKERIGFAGRGGA